MVNGPESRGVHDYDVCVVGPVSRDRVRIRGGPGRCLPGGVVYYAGSTLARLGLRTAVVTRAAAADRQALLGGLQRLGVAVRCRASPESTAFENVYGGRDRERRRQSVTAVASPLRPSDLAAVDARVFYLGPLTRRDMPVSVLELARRRAERVYLDVQGLLRSVAGGCVRPVDWPEKAAGLACVDVLKGDLEEARLLSGRREPEEAARRIAEYGVEEVIITLGSRGSLVLSAGVAHWIPAFPPRQLVDTTGCGDSYLAGYLYRRLRGDDIAAAGRFAAVLASLAVERDGPFAGGEADVLGRLAAEPRG